MTNVFDELKRAALEMAWPTRCIGCDTTGLLLCSSCQNKLSWITQRWACPVCGAPYGWLTCTECRNDWELRSCVSAFIFDGPAARLVSAYKDENERRLAGVLAASIACALDESSSWQTATKPARGCASAEVREIKRLRTRHRGEGRFPENKLDAICFIPATQEAYRRRGFDHMEDVARKLGALLGLPVVDGLMRGTAQDQRALNRTERIENTRGTFRVVEEVRGAHILLVDDVITTGASVREAARALLERGACSVSGASVCRTW